MARPPKYRTPFPQLWDEAWVRSRYESGMDCGQIAAELGCPTSAVVTSLARHCITGRPRAEVNRRIAQTYWAQHRTKGSAA